MEPLDPMAKKQVGATGEQLCALYLQKQGFTILELNYRKNWGEIDVIALKDTTIHFIEVKTVSYETKSDLKRSVLHGNWRPEENVHQFKLQKLARTIETWLEERKWTGNWQIDVVGVRIVSRETYSTINIIENVVI